MNWLEPQGAVGSNPQVLWEIESEVQDSVWRGSGVVRSMSRRDELRPGLTWEEIGLRGQPGAGAVLGSWLWCRLLAGFFVASDHGQESVRDQNALLTVPTTLPACPVVLSSEWAAPAYPTSLAEHSGHS